MVSFTVEVHNHTYATMTLDGTPILAHGAWVDPPAEDIDAQSSSLFWAEGHGEGVEGRARYRISQEHLSDTYVSIYFDNPLIGTNAFSAWADSSDYRFDWGDPGGVSARIDLDVWLTPEGAGALAHDLGCNLSSLGAASPAERDIVLAEMRAFRDDRFKDLPGLEPWWAEFNEAVPRLLTLAQGNEALQQAVDHLLPRAGEFLSNSREVIQPGDVDILREVLSHLAATDSDLSVRFAERGLRILSLLVGKKWDEGLRIVSSVRPHAER